MRKEIIISSGFRTFIIALAGLLSAGLLHGLVFAVITINNLDFSGCNHIIAPHSIAADWYYSSLTLIVLTVVAFVLLVWSKGTSRILSAGIILSVIYPLLIFSKVYADYKDEEKYFRTFDQSEWKKSAYKPLPVARWLDRESILKNRSAREAVTMLGEPNRKSDSLLRYELEFPGVYFDVFIENNIVESDTIRCYL